MNNKSSIFCATYQHFYPQGSINYRLWTWNVNLLSVIGIGWNKIHIVHPQFTSYNIAWCKHPQAKASHPWVTSTFCFCMAIRLAGVVGQKEEGSFMKLLTAGSVDQHRLWYLYRDSSMEVQKVCFFVALWAQQAEWHLVPFYRHTKKCPDGQIAEQTTGKICIFGSTVP